MTNLVTRAELAKQAGVNQSVITRMCEGSLADARVGGRIDANHSTVVAYLAKRATPKDQAAATGIDPLYEKALAACRESDAWTANFLKGALGIGAARGKVLVDLMRVAGVLATTERDIPPVAAAPPPKPRGTRVHAQKIKDAVPEEAEIIEIPENITQFLNYTLQQCIDLFGSDIRMLDWLKGVRVIEQINKDKIANAKAEGDLVSRKLVVSAIIDPIDSMHRKLLTGVAHTMAVRLKAKFGAGATVAAAEKWIADQITSHIRPVKRKMEKLTGA